MNTEPTKDQIRGREFMRLVKLYKDTGPEDLLDAGMNGREKTPGNVAKFYGVVLQLFGYGAVADKFWKDACGPYLEDVGLDEKQLEEIRHPFPEHGEKGFRSILDEMKSEGHEI